MKMPISDIDKGVIHKHSRHLETGIVCFKDRKINMFLRIEGCVGHEHGCFVPDP